MISLLPLLVLWERCIGLRALKVSSTRQPAESVAQRNQLYLRFEVCNGATNQRIALIQGLAIGSYLKAQVLLPQLLSSYQQDVGNRSRFSDYYDRVTLTNRLRGIVKFASERDVDVTHLTQVHSVDSYNLEQPAWYWRQMGERAKKNGQRMINLTCTFNSVSAIGAKNEIKLFWKINRAIRLKPRYQNISDTIANRIRTLSPNNRFTALHLRIEQDWVDHCRVWTGGSNCMGNEDILHTVFAIERVPHLEALYIAGGMKKGDLKKDKRFAQLLDTYPVFMKEDIIPSLYDEFSIVSQRDVLALIDFYACAQADFFVGNSVSTFSAVLELERLQNEVHGGLPTAFHYNGGPIWLTNYMPITELSTNGALPQTEWKRPMKWVFTVSAGSHPKFIEHMKVAVLSALRYTRLVPYCLYAGANSTEADENEQWLAKYGVVVIRHRPEWSHKIDEAFNSAPAGLATTASTNFASANALLATFLRVDIPVVGFADKYVLYTDVDVIFLRDFTWSDYGTPLPEYFTMGTECKKCLRTKDVWDGNAGIMLMNLDGLRKSHGDFVNASFSDRQVQRGLVYKGHPADQGAYKSFYSAKMNVEPAPRFNWRPYWETSASEAHQAAVLHFHGPKYHDYVAYLDNGAVTNVLFKRYLEECGSNEWSCKQWLRIWKKEAECVYAATECALPPRAHALRATALRTSVRPEPRESGGEEYIGMVH